MFYNIAKYALRLMCLVMFRVEVKGLENIPKEGPVIICANHSSNFDPIAAAIYIKRPVNFMAKKELFKNAFMKKLLKGLHAFPVDRDAADMKTFKTTIEILKKGEVLGIFAQGKRVKEGEVNDPKAGVALFALKGNAVVIPAGISGNFKLFSKVRINYGKPVNLDEYRGKRVRTETLEQITGEIMSEVEKLRTEE